MTRITRPFAVLLLVTLIAAPCSARVWKDVTGRYRLKADLVAFDDELVILQRENKELGSCPIDKLSEEDREYLKSKEASKIHNSNLDQTQTWTTANGLKLVGRIVDYAQREVTLQRRRGRTYVNDKVYSNLPDVYRTILRRVVEHFENIEVPDEASLERFVRNLGIATRTYKLSGVIFELENGDEYGLPFFLLSEKDQEVLAQGWDAWLKDQDELAAQNEHSLRLQSQAAAYHQDEQMRQQVARMQFNMQAIQSGLTSAWEVTLYPARGNPGPPLWVVTMGRNSEVATQIALRNNPGYVSGPVRKVSY